MQVERFHDEMDDHTHIAMECKDQNPGPKINHRDGRAIGGGRRASKSGPTSLGGGPSPAAHGVHAVTKSFLLVLTLVLGGIGGSVPLISFSLSPSRSCACAGIESITAATMN